MATDFYWDTNSTTANGDGGGQVWATGLSRISTSASGTVTVQNWSNSGNSAKSIQFGFGTTAGGNLTNGGTVSTGTTGGGTTQVGSIVFNASGNTPYTLQNNSVNGSSLAINTGGLDVPAGYGIVVNSNVSGDTTFRFNPSAGAFQVNLGANQTWQNNSSSYALVMNVPVTGAFSLTTNGAGTIVLGGTNSFSGGLTVSAGTLRATNGSALGAGSVTVSSTATLGILAAITKNISNSGTVSIGAGGNLSASSLGGAMTLGGVSGTVATLTSTLSSGTLSLGSLSAAGNTNVSLAGGSQITASGAIGFTGSGNLITLTGAAVSPGSYTLLQGSTLTNSAGLSITGGGVGNATIGLGSSSVVGRTTYEFASSATALLLNVTGTTYNLTWNGGATGSWDASAASWQQNGAGSNIQFVDNDNASFGSAASISVPTAVTSGSLVIANASGSLDLSGAGSVTAYSISKSGAGAATIGNTVTAASGVSVTGGSLALNGNSTVTAGGATVGNASLTTSSGFTVSAGGLTVNTGGSATLGGSGTVTGGLTVSAGSLTISAAHTINGDTSVSGGGSVTVNAGSLGSGTLTLNNGALTTGSAVSSLANPVAIGTSGGTVTTDNALTLSGAVSGAGNTLTKSGAGVLTVTGGIGTAGSGLIVNISSGSAVFAGANNKVLSGGTLTGNVSLTAGALVLGGAVGGAGTVYAGNGTTIKSDLSAGGGTKTLSNPVSIDGAVSLQSASSRSLQLSGALAGSGTATSAGSAKVSLTGAGSTFTGGLVVAHSAAASGYTEVTTQALGNAGSVVVNANTSRATSSHLSISNSTTGTFGGVISGAGIVGIAGSARATLSGSNTYSGGTLLDGDVGIVSVWDGTAGSLGSGVITAISSSAKITLDPAAASSITFSQAVNTGAGGGTLLAFAGSGKTYLLTGSAAGSGQLKASTGATLDLTGQTAITNTNTGGIEIGNAYVRAASDANLGSGTVNFSGTDLASGWIAATTGTISRAITIGSSGANANVKAVFDTSGNSLTLTGGVSDKAGSTLGQLIKTGAGSLTLSSSNGYTGATTVSAGTLVAGNANAFGTGAIAVSGGVLDLNSLAVGNVITLSGGSLINAANYGGSQTLSSLVSYAAGTVGGTVNVASGGILKGSGVTFTGGVSVGDGGIHAPGNSPGSQTFTNGLSYSGSSTLQWELAGNTDAGASAGTAYDSISVTGGNLSIASGALLDLVFNGAGSAVNWNDAFWNSNHSWTVIGFSGGGTSSDTFSLSGNASSWLDSASTSLAAAMAANSRTVSDFSVANNAGNIVVSYAVVVVPEPASLVLVALGAGCLCLAARRRRT